MIFLSEAIAACLTVPLLLREIEAINERSWDGKSTWRLVDEPFQVSSFFTPGFFLWVFKRWLSCVRIWLLFCFVLMAAFVWNSAMILYLIAIKTLRASFCIPVVCGYLLLPGGWDQNPEDWVQQESTISFVFSGSHDRSQEIKSCVQPWNESEANYPIKSHWWIQDLKGLNGIGTTQRYVDPPKPFPGASRWGFSFFFWVDRPRGTSLDVLTLWWTH